MDWKPEQIKKLDPADMYTRIYEFPEQLQEGFGLPIRNDLSHQHCRDQEHRDRRHGRIGDRWRCFRSYLAEDVKVPIIINRNYGLPSFVDENTLSSLRRTPATPKSHLRHLTKAKSGTARYSLRRPAANWAVSGRGELSSRHLAGRIRATGSPRLFLRTTLHLMEKLVTFPDRASRLTNLPFLREKKELAAGVAESNVAKQIATNAKPDRIVYAGADYYDTVAIRFKGQICENAKQLAYANICPEFNHNELVGFEFRKKMLEKLVVIFLTGPADSVGVTNRFKIINKILKDKGIETPSQSRRTEPTGRNVLADSSR